MINTKISIILTYRPDTYSYCDSQRSWPMRPIVNVVDLMFDTLLLSSRNRNWARAPIDNQLISIVDELMFLKKIILFSKKWTKNIKK